MHHTVTESIIVITIFSCLLTVVWWGSCNELRKAYRLKAPMPVWAFYGGTLAITTSLNLWVICKELSKII